MHTGEVIKFMRKQRNLTQQELADILGVQKSSVQKYENGSVQNLKLETLKKLCREFKTVPYAFVFPEIWADIKFSPDNTDYDLQVIVSYFKLSKAGKKRILDYVTDMGEIEKYRSKQPVRLKTEEWLNRKTGE